MKAKRLNQPRAPGSAYRSKRGSVLIVTTVFATIAALAIGSYIRLAATEMRLANAQFYANASLNLAEAGVEEALYAINLSSPSEEGWVTNGEVDTLIKVVDGIPLGHGGTGGFRVRVSGIASGTPVIVAQGEVLSNGGESQTVRQIEVILDSRSLFANGIMADDIMMRGGNIEVNSMNSETGEILGNARVASTSLKEESMDLGNATIHGSVATRGWDPKTRPNSVITGGITDDFNSDLPQIQLPENDLPYYHYDGGPGVLGDPDVGTMYLRTSDLTLSGDDELRIQGDVVLIVDNDIDITGGAGITIEDGASLKMYVGGDAFIGGTGMVNESNVPSNLQMYGINPESQSFTLAGNAAWHGALYAPTADVEIRGGGSSGVFYGAVVGSKVTMRGNTTFYYDEKLAELVDGNTFAMANWRELFGADRDSSL